MSILTAIFGLPLLGALLVAIIPGNYRFVIRLVALFVTLLSLVCSVVMFVNFDVAKEGFQFWRKIPWVESLGISYHVGVDGINVGLVLMSAIVAFAAVCVSREVETRVKQYYFLLLMMISGILGAFVSLDIFFLYFFHELALIPTFIMIGVWGRGQDRNYAAFKITIYLTAGALIALVGLVALYLQSGLAKPTFDLIEITEAIKAKPLAVGVQQWIFPLLFFGFGILVSLWPFHSWAPIGYGTAPTATAMLHAGALKKFGLYAIIRLAIPLMPDAAREWLNVIAFLCLGNILYCGLVALRQRELNLLLGNSSVAHMGFIFLGIASLSLVGITGAVVIMIAHGLLAALSFAIAGHLYKETGTFNMDKMGGLLKQIPFIGVVAVMAMMAGCGLPGFANFAGEAMTLFGAWKTLPCATIFAIWGGLVLGAVYMLRAIRTILHGTVPEGMTKVADAKGFWQQTPFVLLVGALLLFGIIPGLLTSKITPAAKNIVAMIGSAPVKQAPVAKAAKAAKPVEAHH